METRVYTEENDIPVAAASLRLGGLVAVPTETVYGLCANGLDAEAVAHLYEVKGRPEVKPLSLMVAGPAEIEKYAEHIPPAAFILAARFWPGPLTLVLEAKKDVVPSIVRAGKDTVGLRCPAHPLTLSLLERARLPLAGPSANPSGAPSPTTAQQVLAYFDGQIEGVIDGGECTLSRESTILDLTQKPFKILREGALAKEEIENALLSGVRLIGKDPEDPKFTITDLLPHLAKDQMAKHGSDIIPGEYLNLLAGSVPYAGEGTKRVMLAVMSLLNDRYDITEEDFLSAELEVVPSFEACDIGVDRSFIGGYGQDDRVCAYAELKAIFDTETPDRTAVCILADKEEIGSMGVSGMQSRAFETFMADLCEQQDVHLRDCFENSFCVSADVCNAYDPTFWEVSEYPNRNGARANYGVGICKFTGSRGKSGSNDASAEVVGKLRKIFADNGVVWQMSELGKVDQGGGGTVAQYMANRNIDTIDAGTPVFSMHAPFETVTKFDCYQTYKAMWAFYKDR